MNTKAIFLIDLLYMVIIILTNHIFYLRIKMKNHNLVKLILQFLLRLILLMIDLNSFQPNRFVLVWKVACYRLPEFILLWLLDRLRNAKEFIGMYFTILVLLEDNSIFQAKLMRIPLFKVNFQWLLFQDSALGSKSINQSFLSQIIE